MCFLLAFWGQPEMFVRRPGCSIGGYSMVQCVAAVAVEANFEL